MMQLADVLKAPPFNFDDSEWRGSLKSSLNHASWGFSPFPSDREPKVTPWSLHENTKHHHFFPFPVNKKTSTVKGLHKVSMFMFFFGIFSWLNNTRLQICPLHIFCKQLATDGTSKSKDWWNSRLFWRPWFFGAKIYNPKKFMVYKMRGWVCCWFLFFGLFPLHPKGWLPIPASSAAGRFEPLMCHLHGKIMEPRTLEFPLNSTSWMGGTFPAFCWGGDGRAPSKYDGNP